MDRRAEGWLADGAVHALGAWGGDRHARMEGRVRTILARLGSAFMCSSFCTTRTWPFCEAMKIPVTPS